MNAQRRVAALVLSLSLVPLALAAQTTAAPPAAAAPPAVAPGSLADRREIHLDAVRQLTDGGENAEGYWSLDGRELIFQSQRPPYACDQIFRLRADGTGEPLRVSNGLGRTTCSYFLNNGRVLYSSTHAAGPECPPPPDRSHGYVWAVYPSYEIWAALPDGADPVRLTKNEAYDAEATTCPRDGAVIFTSTRDGDLDLYRMEADGSGVQRLTQTPGYDGGAFFSPDCSQIVWRASRPAPGAELDEYQGLLARGLVRPGKLEIWIADVDGATGIKDARQLTYLDAASFAPSFFPSGKRIIFSSNVGDPAGREFELWAIDTDGSHLERITHSPGFDGFPVFSPDGTRLAFASNRHQGKPGETNLFVARWNEAGPLLGNPAATAALEGEGTNGAAVPATVAADRFAADVAWLADDAREGRGIGTAGLAKAAEWLAGRFRTLGLAPAGEGGGFLQGFDVPVAVASGPETAVAIDGEAVPRESFEPASFSATNAGSPIEAEVVPAHYGITAPELSIDDYAGLDVKGKIVALRRFTPTGPPFEGDVERRYGDLRYKAFNAREHGAVGVIVVDEPPPAKPAPAGAPAPPGAEAPPAAPEAALPKLQVDSTGDAGLPAITLLRSAGAALFAGGHRARLALDLDRKTARAVNIVGLLRAGAAERLPGAVLVGAHYDHLGHGGSSSLAPGSEEVHNGADDNASGTAALLEVARQLLARQGELKRDVYFAAFSGEEEGVLGSTALTRNPPGNLRMADLVAMLNMDMVGRLRENKLSVLGNDSAEGWSALVDPACARAEIACNLGGDGYGPSDQTPFYAAGVPVLHFFSGVHSDYHKPSDDADKINAAGGARVAGLVADIAAAAAARPERLAYKNAPAPLPQGDVRSRGASLGTVPDYAGPPDGRPGVLLAGVRPGSAAEKAGLERGDLLLELAGTQIRDIYDFTFALRKAKPGETATVVFERAGERKSVEVTFGGAGVR